MGRTIVMLVLLLGAGAAAATAGVAADARSATTAAAYRVEGTVTVDWTESAGTLDSGHAVYALSGPVLTNAQRQAYAPIVVPDRFSFRPLAPSVPTYLRAELQSVSWSSTQTIDGCGDGSVSATRTSTAENIVDRRAIFEQATTVNRLGGSSELNLGALTLYVWRNGSPQSDLSAYSNLGEVFVRSTGGCAEVLNGGPRTAQVQMHDLFGVGMLQLGNRGVRVKGRKSADGTFVFRATIRSADAGPSPTSHNTIKVTVDLRVRGASGARGFECVYPSPAQLAPARSVGEAQAVLHRAGIFSGYGGEARNRYVRAGHYFFRSSSPSGPCGVPSSRPGLYRSAG
jgi:hypothetical protein